MQGVPKRRVARLHKRGTTQQRARKTLDKSANYSFTVPKPTAIAGTEYKQVALRIINKFTNSATRQRGPRLLNFHLKNNHLLSSQMQDPLHGERSLVMQGASKPVVVNKDEFASKENAIGIFP